MNNDPNNTVDLFSNLYYKTLYAGAGVKFMYYPGMSFILEINYKTLSGSYTSYPGQPEAYTTESKSSIFSVLLGISILL